MAVATSTIALAVAAGATAYSARQQQVASEQQNRANKARRRMQAYQSAVQRRKQVAQALQARGNLVNTAYAEGTGQTSAAISGAAAGAGQAGSNIGYLNAMEGYNSSISKAENKANISRSRAQTAQAVAGVSKMGYGELFSN